MARRHQGITAGRIALAVSLLFLGTVGALAVSAPGAMACPACEEYIWNPPSPGGKTSPGGPSAPGGSSGSSSPAGPTSGTGTGIGDGTGLPAHAATTGAGGEPLSTGSRGGWENRLGTTAGYGAGPEGAATAGTGVLAASTSAAGESPTGLLVIGAIALIGLAGLLAAWRLRRRQRAL